MKLPVLVDTNLLVPLILNTDKSALARELFTKKSDWISESLILIEFSSVLRKYMRHKILDLADATKALDQAELLFPQERLVSVTHTIAFAVAVEFNISVYDARYIALARDLNTRVVTEDKPLRKAAPELTMSLDEALAQ